ncbi:hypothetical protein PV783_33890 [Chitinophaga sp. CC14]|uniref:hypothetical protein n=1 Tax=Chitinophaga sp. CC14 TaxID=3029199 RepID=UPI003B8071DC
MEKIYKPKARKLWDTGKSFIAVSHKFSPHSVFAFTIDPTLAGVPFDEWYNAFCYYNCNMYETGYYPAFYIPA